MCLLSTRAQIDLLKGGVPVRVIGCIEFVLMGFAWGMLACKFAGKPTVLTYGRLDEPICQLWRLQKSSSCPVCAARRPREGVWRSPRILEVGKNSSCSWYVESASQTSQRGFLRFKNTRTFASSS